MTQARMFLPTITKAKMGSMVVRGVSDAKINSSPKRIAGE